MGIVKTLGDFFRKTPTSQTADNFGILSPLMTVSDYVKTTQDFWGFVRGGYFVGQLYGKKPLEIKAQDIAKHAYLDYVKHLSSQEQHLEKSEAFVTINMTLAAISANLTLIEDNFQSLFGNLQNPDQSHAIKASSLLILGYLEKAEVYCTWLGYLGEHLMAGPQDLITPFHTKQLLAGVDAASEFSAYNLHKWNPKSGGILNDVKAMQAKGNDLHVQTDGVYIDDIAHDDQFSAMDQQMLSASLRSLPMMVLTGSHVAIQARIDFLERRKDWLVTKVMLEQLKLRGTDPFSPEYKKLSGTLQHYSDLISKYEKKLEWTRS